MMQPRMCHARFTCRLSPSGVWSLHPMHGSRVDRTRLVVVALGELLLVVE